MGKNRVDVSAYLVVGPENTLGRPVRDVVSDAVRAGFTAVQIRSKTASARELIGICRESAIAIGQLGKSDSVSLLVDDRLDIVLAAREEGIKVDGIHVGQKDIPVSVCRKYLGEDAVVGLSARTFDLLEYARGLSADEYGMIDYFGAGPLHKTQSKADAGLDLSGNFHTRNMGELSELARISRVPVVVGGGVTVDDIPALRSTGVAGFFVISAVAGAENPFSAASALVSAWRACGSSS